MNIEEATQDTIAEFAYRNEPLDPDDPLFEPLSWETGDAAWDDDASPERDIRMVRYSRA